MQQKTNKAVYILLSASPDVGLGHLFRCIPLSVELKKKFSSVVFCLPEKDSAFIKNLNINLENINYFKSMNGNDIVTYFKDINSQIIVIDSYLIDQVVEFELAKKNQVVAIDDLGRKHSSQMIVDPSLNGSKSEKYKFSSGKVVGGPKYTMLRNEFQVKLNKILNNLYEKVFIYLGTTQKETIEKLLMATRRLNPKEILILAPLCTDVEKIKLKDNEELLTKTSSCLTSLYSRSSICFGACGVAQIERIAIGMPTICFQTVDNQSENVDFILKNNLAPFVGDLRFLTEDEIYQKLLSFKELTSKSWESFIEASAKIIDKDGCINIVNEIINEFVGSAYERQA